LLFFVPAVSVVSVLSDVSGASVVSGVSAVPLVAGEASVFSAWIKAVWLHNMRNRQTAV
jgi:hypothetical protein